MRPAVVVILLIFLLVVTVASLWGIWTVRPDPGLLALFPERSRPTPGSRPVRRIVLREG